MLPAPHQFSQQGCLGFAQLIDQVTRNAAQLDRGAGHGIVLVGLLQQRLLTDQVTAAGQPHDAPVTTFGDAFEAHHAGADGEDGLGGLAAGIQAFVGCMRRGCDGGMDAHQRVCVQRAEERTATHLAGGADTGLRVGVVHQVQRQSLGRHGLDRALRRISPASNYQSTLI